MNDSGRISDTEEQQVRRNIVRQNNIIIQTVGFLTLNKYLNRQRNNLNINTIKMRNNILPLCTLAFSCISFCMGCKNNNDDHKSSNKTNADKTNAVYYWRTTLECDSVEQDFLQANNVDRAYVRFFDIVVDESPIAMDAVVPNATLQIKDTLPIKDIVPTIYITPEAIVKMQSNEEVWAEKIVKRIYNMCSYNELDEPKELQLDCDWTMRTQQAFFSLCTAVKNEIQKRNPQAILSATIRLHQLKTPVPPVDYGVLMLYNTGSFENPEEPNSIIWVENIKPYLKYLAYYSLRLDYAYPIFSWNLVYNRDKSFKGLINSSSDLPDNILTHISGNNYKVAKDTIINNIYLYQGDIIRKEDAPLKTILEIKKMIEQDSCNKNCNIILYQLDKKNISNYSSDEFKQIYK